jgi:hypothetical protein
MNHFMARMIFCFFAEDTDIFNGTGLFTAAIEQMSARDIWLASFRLLTTRTINRLFLVALGLRPCAAPGEGAGDTPRFFRVGQSRMTSGAFPRV